MFSLKMLINNEEVSIIDMLIKCQFLFKVKCAIRARKLPNSLPTIFKESSEFYAGIVVSST